MWPAIIRALFPLSFLVAGGVAREEALLDGVLALVLLGEDTFEGRMVGAHMLRLDIGAFANGGDVVYEHTAHLCGEGVDLSHVLLELRGAHFCDMPEGISMFLMHVTDGGEGGCGRLCGGNLFGDCGGGGSHFTQGYTY